MELIHTNFCEPTRIRGLNGERHFMLLIYDFSRMTRVTFVKDKFEAFDRFKVFKSMVDNQVDANIKCVRSDKGREVISWELDIFCEIQGIRRHFSHMRTP